MNRKLVAALVLSAVIGMAFAQTYQGQTNAQVWQSKTHDWKVTRVCEGIINVAVAYVLDSDTSHSAAHDTFIYNYWIDLKYITDNDVHVIIGWIDDYYDAHPDAPYFYAEMIQMNICAFMGQNPDRFPDVYPYINGEFAGH